MADDEPRATPGQMVLNAICGLLCLAFAGFGAWSYYDDNWGAGSCAARPRPDCLEAPWGALTLRGRGGAVMTILAAAVGLRLLWTLGRR